jgi:hypothetical protein
MLNLHLELSDIYGGDGFTRVEQVEELKLSRSRRKVQVRTDVSIPFTDELAERRTEVVDRGVNTFKRGEDGAYYLRLGGSHGKLWGAMKESAEILKDVDGTFKSFSEISRLMRSVRILPVWVELKNPEGIRLEKEPQILAGSRSSMITLYFDVISKAACSVELIFPDAFEPRMKKMLSQLESLNVFNRRRATVRVESAEVAP